MFYSKSKGQLVNIKTTLSQKRGGQRENRDDGWTSSACAATVPYSTRVGGLSQTTDDLEVVVERRAHDDH